MEPMELHRVARATSRAGRNTPRHAPADRPAARARVARDTPRLAEVAIDEELARRACAPMGALDSIVVSRTARNATHTYYVIVPDPATEAEYAKLGLDLEPGCRVLVDAAVLKPLAVLSVTRAASVAPPPPAAAEPHVDEPRA